MLKRLGVKYVIVGHSERRWPGSRTSGGSAGSEIPEVSLPGWNPSASGGESDEVVNKKLKTILANEFTPIVCVRERERDAGFKDFLKNQVEATFPGLSADEIGKCLIAYEPVWAISSNSDAHSDTPDSALESIAVIKDCLAKSYSLTTNPLFLYGGSVVSSNVRDFLSSDQIAGVLVGGASVNKEEFVGILKNS
jgi:triosephosphate isomerase